MAVLFLWKLSEFFFRGAAVIDATLFMGFSFLLIGQPRGQRTVPATSISAPLCNARLLQTGMNGGRCTSKPMSNFTCLGRILRRLLPVNTVQRFTLVEQQENRPLC
jgi:hypothetical protein